MDAYDAKSGKQAWRFWTIPGPGEPGHETWAGESWKTGGGPTWVTGAYDAELRLVYWGVGNPSPDWNGDARKGDNLYACSFVALDGETGKLRWHFQFTPHDTHDWDAAHVPILFDAEIQGRDRKLIASANRNAFYYARRARESIAAAVQTDVGEGLDAKGGDPGGDSDPSERHARLANERGDGMVQSFESTNRAVLRRCSRDDSAFFKRKRTQTGTFFPGGERTSCRRTCVGEIRALDAKTEKQVEFRAVFAAVGGSTLDRRTGFLDRMKGILCPRCADRNALWDFSNRRRDHGESHFVHGGWQTAGRDQRGPCAVRFRIVSAKISAKAQRRLRPSEIS